MSNPNIPVRLAVKRLINITIADLQKMSDKDAAALIKSLPLVSTQVEAELRRREILP